MRSVGCGFGLGALIMPTLFGGSFSLAQDQRSYWLKNASENVVSCPAAKDGDIYKVANGSKQWLLVSGLISCEDKGAHYKYHIQFLNISINPARRDDIDRAEVKFDWIGLAVFRPATSGTTIEWLFDEVVPVEANLSRISNDKVAIGLLDFEVPKEAVQKASNMTFYLTAEGIPFVFGFL